MQPATRAHCERWTDALGEVINRASNVCLTAYAFKFDPAELPTVLPYNPPKARVSHTTVGVVLRPDDHGRGAVLEGYSPSRQLALHGIPLQTSALVRVNDLVVVHLPHAAAVSALEHAVKVAERIPRRKERAVTLEFCTVDDYYQCVAAGPRGA